MTTITKEIIPHHAEFISASRCGVKHLWLTQG